MKREADSYKRKRVQRNTQRYYLLQEIDPCVCNRFYKQDRLKLVSKSKKQIKQKAKKRKKKDRLNYG